VTAPGERYHYSNLGYGLLDYIISHASGKSYAQYVRDEVFRPLGMDRSSIDIAPEFEPYAAARYGEDNVPYPFYDFDHPGGSAAYCSAHDLIRFGMFHLKEHLADQEAILSDESIDEMQKTTPMTEGSAPYGIGWAVQDDPRGFHSVMHSGGMGGVSTVLSLLPERRIAIVVLCNQACELPAAVRSRILDLLLPETAAEPVKEEAPPTEKSAAPADDFTAVNGKWSGSLHTYNGNLPVSINISPSGEAIAQIGNAPAAAIEALGFRDDCLTGVTDGCIETEDTDRYPYRLHLDLRLREDILNGAITAQTHQDGPYGGAPGKRQGSALSSWVELRRVS
nr:beta-lactamase family protein [Armatimonadota bacterium]